MKRENFYTRLNKDERYIMKCVFFVFAVNGLYGMILGSLLPLISAEYQLSDTVSGSLLSAHSLGNLVSGFLAGVLPAYLGRKRSVIFLSSFVSMGFLIMILTGQPGLLLLGFLFTGISRGGISNFNNAMVNEVSDSSPAALSFLHSIFAIGALLSPYLVIAATRVAGPSGWKLAAGVIIVLTLTSLVLFRRMKIEDSRQRRAKVVSYDFMKRKLFWSHAGVLFFYLCAEATINGWIVKYFVDAGIMSLQYAQVLASFLWIAILVGRLSIAYVGDQVRKEYLLLGLSLSTTLFYLLLLSSRDTTTITVAIFGIGLSMAGIYPATVSSVGAILKEFPMSMGVLLVLGGIGAIIMPMVTGALSDAFGIFAGMSAIVVALVLMIASVLLSLHFKGTASGSPS